ncbi:MAG TPA: GNAT family N-acetyltransferase [Acidimicrobiales bacterium]|nr:GNAT family N-acetyltransferase [Acidimicrobiales bacterium]
MRTQPRLVVRDMRSDDVDAVVAILRSWVQAPWMEEAFPALRASAEAVTDQRFVVAESVPDGAVVGVMGLMWGDIDPELLDGTEATAELVRAYVADPTRGTGVGTALADHLEGVAREMGFTRLVIESGSIHRETGYPFWRRRYGEPFLVSPDHWGPGVERVAWRTSLTD